jgi:hypothetical protein
MALHAKAKAEGGYRFYALYDKIGREDILAHAYAQCRSNKGAPGVDGQDFADIETYGVERWLAELALALREETYRPEPIRRVFIPKANGKLRPLGISTVRDRVCMTAAMLVLEPIFEADLPPEIYAYRAGRNAQQAAPRRNLKPRPPASPAPPPPRRQTAIPGTSRMIQANACMNSQFISWTHIYARGVVIRMRQDSQLSRKMLFRTKSGS